MDREKPESVQRNERALLAEPDELSYDISIHYDSPQGPPLPRPGRPAAELCDHPASRAI